MGHSLSKPPHEKKSLARAMVLVREMSDNESIYYGFRSARFLTNVISPERPSLVPSSPLAAQRFSYKQCELVYLPVCVLFGCPPLRSGATSYSPSFPAHGKYSVHSIHFFIHPPTHLFAKCSVCARHCSRLQRPGEEQESQSRTPPGGGMAFHTSSLPTCGFCQAPVFWEGLALHRSWSLWSVE